MKVSLIMPTINVTDELILFLDSLSRQTFKDFELIVIDQNKHDEVFEILKRYEKIRPLILHNAKCIKHLCTIKHDRYASHGVHSERA